MALRAGSERIETEQLAGGLRLSQPAKQCREENPLVWYQSSSCHNKLLISICDLHAEHACPKK